jgi:hypothetical protein
VTIPADESIRLPGAISQHVAVYHGKGTKARSRKFV